MKALVKALVNLLFRVLSMMMDSSVGMFLVATALVGWPWPLYAGAAILLRLVVMGLPRLGWIGAVIWAWGGAVAVMPAGVGLVQFFWSQHDLLGVCGATLFAAAGVGMFVEGAWSWLQIMLEPREVMGSAPPALGRARLKQPSSPATPGSGGGAL